MKLIPDEGQIVYYVHSTAEMYKKVEAMERLSRMYTVRKGYRTATSTRALPYRFFRKLFGMRLEETHRITELVYEIWEEKQN